MTLIPAKDYIRGKLPNLLYVSDELYDLMKTYGIKLLVKSIKENTYSEIYVEPKTRDQVINYMVLYGDYSREAANGRLNVYDIDISFFSSRFMKEFQEEYYFTCKDNDMLMLFKLAL